MKVHVYCRGCGHKVRVTKKGTLAWHYDDAAFLVKCEWSGDPAKEHAAANDVSRHVIEQYG